MTLVTRLYVQLKEAIHRLGDDESGATAIEYGLIAALISVAIIGALSFVGDQLFNIFNNIGSELDQATK